MALGNVSLHRCKSKKGRRQVNEKFLRIQRRAYRDGVKRRETRPGWSGCCHGDELCTPRMYHTIPILLFQASDVTI